jgi:spermidine synthase
LPTAQQLRERALNYEPALRGFGVDVQAVLPLFTTNIDWDTRARVLTDQYSPANLLNR